MSLLVTFLIFREPTDENLFSFEADGAILSVVTTILIYYKNTQNNYPFNTPNGFNLATFSAKPALTTTATTLSTSL